MDKPNRVYVGKQVYDLESALTKGNGEYSKATNVLHVADLLLMNRELSSYQNGLYHFYNVFCPLNNLSKEDVERFVAEYKSLNVPEYFEVKGKETLNQQTLFGGKLGLF